MSRFIPDEVTRAEVTGARAEEAYRPVRDEIARWFDEACDHRRTEERRRGEEPECWWREDAPLQWVARRTVWIFIRSVDWCYAYRQDVAPSPHMRRLTEFGRPPRPITVESMEEYAREHPAHVGHWYPLRIEWDPATCAVVEQECADLGRPVTFARWWDAVTRWDWTTGEEPGPNGTRIVSRPRDVSLARSGIVGLRR